MIWDRLLRLIEMTLSRCHAAYSWQSEDLRYDSLVLGPDPGLSVLCNTKSARRPRFGLFLTPPKRRSLAVSDQSLVVRIY